MKTFYTVLLITAMSVATAVAQPGRGDGEGSKGDSSKQRPNREQLAKKLDLTPEQQKALKELRQDFQVQMIDLRASVQKARLEVKNQMSREAVNRDDIMLAVETEAAAELAVKKAMIDHQLKVREVVGPEKAEQMIEMMQDRHGGDRRGPSGGPGGDGGRGQGPGRDGDSGW